MISSKSVWLTTLTLLLAGIVAHGQFGVGGIIGTVRDASESIVPGARVVAKEVSTGVETAVTSTATGAYRFLNLPLGTYSVTVGTPGFVTVQKSGIRVILGQTATVDFELPVGQLNESVTVTSSPATEDTTSTTTGITRLSEELEHLPLAVSGGPRSSATFLRTVAGVNYRDPALDQTRVVIHGVGDSGGFRSAAGFKVDGVDANVTGNQTFNHGLNQQVAQQSAVPIPDLVAEFRVVTNQDAENGFNQGASIELVTKSGTNDLHGTVFYYNRNDAFDARSFFAAKRDINRQHEFGGVIGGPIVKDKHFFFGSYDEFRRSATGGGLIRSLPSERMRMGDFSEWLGPQLGTDALGRPYRRFQIYDPLTTRADGKGGFIRDPFPGNIIPADRLSPISQFLQRSLPLPNRGGLQDNTIVSLRPGDTRNRTWNIKTDHALGNHKLSGFFEHEKQDIDVTDLVRGVGWLPLELETDGAKDEFAWRTRLHHTWTIRPNLIYTFRMGILYGKTNQGVPEEALNYGKEAGLTGLFSPRAPRVMIARTETFGNMQTLSNSATNIPARVDMAWVKGNHEVKFGLEYKLGGYVTSQDRLANGGFSFGDGSTGIPLIVQTGIGYASFLLGEVASADLQFPTDGKNTHSSWGLYAQDKWRVTPRLTVNYGLRWDIFQMPYESYDRMASFDPSIPNPSAGGLLGALTFYGQGPGRNGRTRVIETAHKNFAPRLGLAFQVDSLTVMRAHYGVNYYPVNNLAVNGQFVPNYGWGASVNATSQNSGVTPAFNWNNGFPNLLPPLPNLSPSLQNGSDALYFDPKEQKVGMSQTLGFSLERRLPWDVTVKAEYAGNLSHNLFSDGMVGLNQLPLQYLSLGNLLLANINSAAARAANIPIPYPGFAGTVQQALRPYPHFQNIVQYNAMAADNLYHGAEFFVQKRFSSGFQFLVAYAFSKTLTNDGLASNGSGSGARNIPHSDFRGKMKFLAAHDRAQTLNLSWSYELPFGTGKRFLNTANPLGKQLFGGWTISAMQNYGSGVPITIGGARGIPTAGPAFVLRDNSVPFRTGVSCSDYDPNDPSKRLFNVGAFSDPAPFALGNTRVLPDVRHCGYLNEDVSIVKRFPMREHLNLEFGANFFNIFNRHYWRDPGFRGAINAPAIFGNYTQVGPPRSIQFNLRLRF